MARAFLGADYVQFTDPGFTIGVNIACTVSFWCKNYTLGTGRRIFSSMNVTGSTDGFNIVTRSGSDGSRFDCINARTTSPTRCEQQLNGMNPVGVWHHNCSTQPIGFTGNNIDWFVDGVLVANGGADGSGSAAPGDGDYFIGSDTAGGNNFVGEIADLCIWDRTLTAAEVSLLRNYSGLYIRKGLRFAVTFLGESIYDVKRGVGPVAVVGTRATPHPRIIYPHNRLAPFAFNTVGVSPTQGTLGIMTTRTGWWGDL